MAQTSAPTELSLAQLEHLLNTRRRQIERLAKKRKGFEAKIKAIDEQITALGGPGSGGRHQHARNAVSLIEAITQVLTKAGEARGRDHRQGACRRLHFHEPQLQSDRQPDADQGGAVRQHVTRRVSAQEIVESLFSFHRFIQRIVSLVTAIQKRATRSDRSCVH
jgi:hypothetical protein